MLEELKEEREGCGCAVVCFYSKNRKQNNAHANALIVRIKEMKEAAVHPLSRATDEVYVHRVCRDGEIKILNVNSFVLFVN